MLSFSRWTGLGFCALLLLRPRGYYSAQARDPNIIVVDATGGANKEDGEGLSRIVEAVRQGKFSDASYFASSFCGDLGLTYRYHFEQQCPSKVMKHALGKAGTSSYGIEEGARSAREAVDVLLEDCRRLQIMDATNRSLTGLQRVERMSPCDLPALEAGLTLEHILAEGGVGYPHGQREMVQDLPRLSVSDASDEETLRMAKERGPFVVEGESKIEGGGVGVLDTIVSAVVAAGFQPEAEYYPSGLQTFDKHNKVRKMMILNEAASELKADTDGAYVHWYMSGDQWDSVLDAIWGAKSDKELPFEFLMSDGDGWFVKCFDEGMKSQWQHNLRWFGLYAGTPNVGMFAHKDRHATSSFQVQLGGAKRWRLCDPHAHLGDEAMYSKFR